MNKWIPISLFVFLGIYLLTTAQTPVNETPVKQAAGDLHDDFNNIITSTQH